MFNPFICGTFHHLEAEHDDDDEPRSSTPPPRKCRKTMIMMSICKSRASENPYANHGLDKFSALLADLDNKRREIYAQVGSQHISLVRFAYSSSNDCKPIVVKVRDKKQDITTHVKDEPITHDVNEVQQPGSMLRDLKGKERFSWSSKFTVIVVLILLFLAVFGRSFVILCISIGWYLVPTIEGVSYSSKWPWKKEGYFGKLRGNKLN
ncbi:uncharacterized protein LOC132279013 [Cornus florida]|uniref:uncharacterized protein LOC132279013 n=1 Tax=Cornus florida TaxID=4283 RepID=UPI00289E2EB7|nr:uncharacterized protein LOC132279013 [Cornus florida]